MQNTGGALVFSRCYEPGEIPDFARKDGEVSVRISEMMASVLLVHGGESGPDFCGQIILVAKLPAR
jgi:hypothetical protein